MQLKAVGRVSMGDVRFEVGRQVDDVDCTKRAFLGTDTTSNAETLGDESNLGFGGDFDTETSASHHRARFLTLLPTFLYGSISSPPCRRTNVVIYLRFALQRVVH